MFTLSVEMSFKASHQLVLPDGSKEPTHRHNWSATAEVGSEKLDDAGVVMDFHRLRAELGNILAGFDNSQLAAVDYFRQNNPSAENVAKYIFDRLEARLPQGVNLRSVKVEEERGCWAKFASQEIGL